MSEPLDVDAIRARLAAAAPVPWNTTRRGLTWRDRVAAALLDGGLDAAHSEALADQISHAPTDLAALLAERDRLLAHVAALEARRDDRRQEDIERAERDE